MYTCTLSVFASMVHDLRMSFTHALHMSVLIASPKLPLVCKHLITCKIMHMTRRACTVHVCRSNYQMIGFALEAAGKFLARSTPSRSSFMAVPRLMVGRTPRLCWPSPTTTPSRATRMELSIPWGSGQQSHQMILISPTVSFENVQCTSLSTYVWFAVYFAFYWVCIERQAIPEREGGEGGREMYILCALMCCS
jgi:hypothetical protein